MSDEPAVLRRIGERLRRARARGSGPHDVVAAPSQPATPVGADPVEPFTTIWQALAGHVHQATPSTIDAVVAGICRGYGAATVLSWNDPWLAPMPIVSRLRALDLALDFGDLPAERDARRARLGGLATIGVGLTGTFGAIAESGSVVVVSGPGRSPLASLLPPVHIAIVRRDRVCATLPDFLRQHPRIEEEGSNLVLISGPSRTADIEMTLTRGVHGPGEVHVVLLDGVVTD